jgi:hypothetical protein
MADALLADNGYDADAIRADLAKRSIIPVIRPLKPTNKD